MTMPVFRRVTVQYKVFLQMAFMTMGGMIEADRRMVEYELVVRHRKRLERARMARVEYERELKDAAIEDDLALEDQIRAAELRSRKSSKRVTDT
jgi:hypothetical protein